MAALACLAEDANLTCFRAATLCKLLCVGFPAQVGAQQTNQTLAPHSARDVRVGERLSDWILRQPDLERDFELGLMLQTKSQEIHQGWIKRELLAGAGGAGGGAGAGAAGGAPQPQPLPLLLSPSPPLLLPKRRPVQPQVPSSRHLPVAF